MTVARRWAMMKAVRPRSRLFSAVWMRASLGVSSELVASSRTTSTGSSHGARAIPLAELVTALADDRGVPFGQGPGEVEDQRRPGCGLDAGIVRPGRAVADVVGQAHSEDDGVLRDHADLDAEGAGRKMED